jgi:phytoene synthase
VSEPATQLVAAEDDAAKRASGSTFYRAMRILPPPQRHAMYEIYSFCRKVDDIADDPGDRTVRLAQLQQWRRDIDAICAGRVVDGLAGLIRATREFGLAREDFLAVIDGMEMDVVADIRAPDLATLDLYCDRVASAVGRLSVKVFGLDADTGRDLAHHLGRALQLTNILRDIDEDAGIGRLYLPREALMEAGITATEPGDVIAHPGLGRACAPIIARIREHFARADAIMNGAPRRAVRAPRIMGEAYKGYFNALIVRGFAPPREKVRLSKVRLLWIILRYAVV